jgi:hypothetical protein
MSDELKNENPTVTIPVSEYQKLQADSLRYFGEADAASRQVAALRAERDGESIAKVVRTVAESIGVRPEAMADAVALLAPSLRVENGEVRVKGQPDQNLSDYLEGFFAARPHWVQSSKASALGRPVAPSAPGTAGVMTGVPVPAAPAPTLDATALTTMARAMTYAPGQPFNPARGSR